MTVTSSHWRLPQKVRILLLSYWRFGDWWIAMQHVACKMLHAALDCPTSNQSRISLKISPWQNLFRSTSKSFQIYQHPSICGFRNLCTNFGIHQAGCCEHSALAHIASAPGCCWSLALDKFQALVQPWWTLYIATSVAIHNEHLIVGSTMGLLWRTWTVALGSDAQGKNIMEYAGFIGLLWSAAHSISSTFINS